MFCICYSSVVFSQMVVNPIFDNLDTPEFRVEKVILTSDTTFVYCSYQAEERSWASISKDTYLEEIESNQRLPLLKVKGLPFSPDKRSFSVSETIQIVLCFPCVHSTRFNIIEDANSKSFNIYGININNSYTSIYKINDIGDYFQEAQQKQQEKDWESAISYTNKQLEASKYVYGEKSIPCSWAMFNFMGIYFQSKEYEKVIEWGKKALEILCYTPQDSANLDLLARTYGNLSSAYHCINQHEVGYQYMELSLAIRRAKDGVGALNYEEYLRHMSKLYYSENNYPKALLYGREVANIYANKYNDNPSKYGCAYVQSLVNLCEFYQRMNQFNEAKICGEQALGIIVTDVCDDERLKCATYINLAGALSTLGEIDRAISLLEQVTLANRQNEENKAIIYAKMLLADILLECKQDTVTALNYYIPIAQEIEKRGETYSDEYISILHKLYRVNIIKNHDIGKQYLEKAIYVQKEKTGDESIAYGNLLLEYIQNIWAEAILEKKGIDSLIYCLQKSFEIFKRHINNSSYNMSKRERENYWLRYKSFFTWQIPTICSLLEGIGKLSSLSYDSSLFYKGMLLASEKEFKDIISSSNDSVLIKTYEDYIRNISLLENGFEKRFDSIIIDSLKTEIQNEEYVLSQKVTRFNKQFKGTDYSWKEVKNNLKKGDVAIEIVSYDAINGSTVYYDAYVIKYNSSSPLYIRLFDEGMLQQYVSADSINYCGLSKLIWGNEKLNKSIKGARNLYFSASGLLNSIGIEYLPLADGNYIFDYYNIYRLSSTRELCYPSIPSTIEKVCLIGGLDYNCTYPENVDNNGHSYMVSRSIKDTIVERGGFDPLPGSKLEIDEVRNEMAKNNIYGLVYTDSDGTEDTFKKMSGSQINIIHFSTHGAYVSNDKDQLGHKDNLHFIISDNNANGDDEAQSLSRSFLVMSGGNKLIHRDTIPNGYDDGILTALEISHLDFKDLDLVVLSACQTALGVIGSEGVYGLQRGFKKAGANTILMSLDKVDDEATRILMVEFYKNLMSGKTKQESLREAQKHLRTVEGGKYGDPRYWASFIMLDGLE